MGHGQLRCPVAERRGADHRRRFQTGDKIALGLQQRDLPVGGGWHVNNGLGTINTANIDLLRNQLRFYLPTAPILGASSEWFGPGSAQILGSVGEPGLFQGVRVPGFETLGGSIATLGGQWSPSDPWDLGGQVVGAHDVTALNGFTSSTDAQQSSTTGLLTAAWHNPVARAQLNLIDGSVSGTNGGTGGWLDSSLSSGRMLHSAGLFRVDPNLSWGNQPIVSDAQGGYYRNSYQSRRWQTDLGVDYLDSISGRGASSTYYSGNARYQVSRDVGIGGSANIRESSGAHGWSTQSYVDWRNALGMSRAQVNYAADEQRHDSALTLDQAWKMPEGTRLSTSLTVEQLSGTDFEDHTALGLSVYGGGNLSARLSVDGNIHVARAIQGSNAPATAANVALTWQLFAQLVGARHVLRESHGFMERDHGDFTVDASRIDHHSGERRAGRVPDSPLPAFRRRPLRAARRVARHRLGSGERHAVPRCQFQWRAGRERKRRGQCHGAARRPFFGAHRLAGTLRVPGGCHGPPRADRGSRQPAAAVDDRRR